MILARGPICARAYLRAWTPCVWLVLLLVLSGCVNHGHRTIVRDRFDYSGAIARSWQQQMLLNLVRLRYLEPPIFLDVAQVVAQYTFEGNASLNAPDWLGNPAGSAAGIGGRWAESPTITFDPMTGEKFTKSLLRPVSPAALLSLVQVGWPIDALFSLGVRAINGLHAGSRTAMLRRTADPDFYKLLALLRDLQLSGSVGLRVHEEEDGSSGVLVFRRDKVGDESFATSHEVRRLLGLNPDESEFTIEFGHTARSDTELAFLTRSMLEMLGEAAMGVDIPARDLAEGRAVLAPADMTAIAPPLVKVYASRHAPSRGEASAAVLYRDNWFWVSDRDLRSKRGMGFLMVLFMLAQTGTTVTPPVLTISKP